MPISKNFYRRHPMIDEVGDITKTILLASDYQSGNKTVKRFSYLPLADEQTFPLTEENRHMYEILPPNTPIKLYFDLEMERHDGTTFTRPEMEHCCEEFIFFVASEIQKQFGITLLMSENDIVIESSCRVNKLSFHVIINRKLYFASVADAQMFIQYLKHRFDHPQNDYEKETFDLLSYSTPKGEKRFIFDVVPYSSYQLFRFLGQSKLGGEHVLVNHTPYWSGIDTLVRLYSDPGDRRLIDRTVLEELLKAHDKTQSIVQKIAKKRESGKGLGEFSNPGILNTIGETLVERNKITKTALAEMPAWKRCLSLIPNTLQDRVIYRNVAMAVRGAGGEIGDFLEWAKLSTKYTGGEWVRANWYKLNTQSAGQVCFATPHLRSLAAACNPEYFRTSDETIGRYFELNLEGLNVIREKSQFVSQEGTPDGENIHDPAKHLILHAYLGRGKTTAIKRLLKSHTSYLFLSSRQTFATFVASEFEDSVCYLDCESTDYDHSKFIISVESLHKIQRREYDVVCLDESESLFAQFSSPTMAGNQIQTWDILSEIIGGAKKVVYADAFLTSRTIDIVKHFAGAGGDRITLIQNATSPVERTAVEILPDVFCKTLMTKLKDEKKIYACYSSASKLVANVNQLKGAAMENEVLAGKMAKALIYHSGVDDRVFHSLKTINESWGDASVVITSPSNTVGCSYSPDEPADFHEIMVNAYPTCTVRDSFQTFARVRHLKDNKMTYCLPDAKSLNFSKLRYSLQFYLFDEYESFCLDKKDTMRGIIAKLIELRKRVDETDKCADLYTIMKTHETRDDTPEVLKRLYYFNLYEETVSCVHYERMFRCFLQKCGYVSEAGAVLPKAKDLEDEDKDKSLIALVNEEERYENLPVLDNDYKRDACALAVKGKRATSIQKLQMRKYWFDRIVTAELDADDRSFLFHEVFSSTHGEKAIRNLRLLHDDALTKVLGRDYEGASIELNDMNAAQLSVIKDLNERLGINPMTEKQTVTNEQLVALIPYLEENTKAIYTTFKLRNRLKPGVAMTSKTVGFIVKAVYSAWCGLGFAPVNRVGHRATSYTTVQQSLKRFESPLFKEVV